jgi:hypothetical protein
MLIAAECRERAWECKRLADQAISLETRETLLYISMRWHQLAEETRKSEHNNTAHAPPFPSVSLLL